MVHRPRKVQVDLAWSNVDPNGHGGPCYRTCTSVGRRTTKTMSVAPPLRTKRPAPLGESAEWDRPCALDTPSLSQRQSELAPAGDRTGTSNFELKSPRTSHARHRALTLSRCSPSAANRRLPSLHQLLNLSPLSPWPYCYLARLLLSSTLPFQILLASSSRPRRSSFCKHACSRR